MAVPKHLAVVVVPSSALTRLDAGRGYGGYRIYLPVNSDPRVENTIHDAVRAALISVRTRERGVDAADVEAMLRVDRPQSLTVSAEGERASDVGFARSLPFIFTMLMFMGVMVAGQGLLTTTIEEKSSRVVEVMLSAVSPLELMTGKLLGQLAVGLLSIGVYIGLGLMALASVAMLGLLDMSLLVYLVVYFVVTYLLLGSIMMAIGAAVNEMREAQSLMMPITLMLVLPWVVAAPILQNPSSTFATALSFIPPVNTFAMLLRLTSTAPPPAWQASLTAAIGLVAAAGVVWCAAKVYRIGLLMYGKPPDFATLVRWVRAA
jgi:ABC-2 type transport system permease protein